jgi:hypothetical protein
MATVKIPGMLLFYWLFLHTVGHSQNLTFSQPVRFSNATTDKAPGINHFKAGYFITWKETGTVAAIHVCYLGKQYDTGTSPAEKQSIGAKSAFAPVLQVSGNRLYLFWISTDNQLQYIINDTDTSFNIQQIYTLSSGDAFSLQAGISATTIDQKILIATHTSRKDQMAYLLAAPGADGALTVAATETISNARSADYPFVTTLSDAVVRFSWRDYKKQDLYYADHDMHTKSWSTILPVATASSAVTPAMYNALHAGQLFYLWKGSSKDNRIYYTATTKESAAGVQNILPDYFTTTHPVSVCTVDDNNFIMVHSGEDQRLYLSHFSQYNPASWMGDLLLPSKAQYSLKDIVIPGSHDAGMSSLTAAGGTQSGTINECNTLTQKQKIGNQLNAGIRLFDLRVGTYNKQLYAKHCAADCMEDAIGGGYGEKLKDILTDTRNFLHRNKQEIVLLTFSHFCERETPVKALGDSILNVLGKELVFFAGGRPLHTIPLHELAGKVVLTFEHYANATQGIDSCSTLPSSGSFINFNREYAATNDITKMIARQEVFFQQLEKNIRPNDLVRLDWQLTQSHDEAAMVCNNFQSEEISPVINSVLFLTSVIKKHQSIIDLSVHGNKYLPAAVNGWIEKKLITAANKPNVIYVDAAGTWVTDYCIDLNKTSLYAR